MWYLLLCSSKQNYDLEGVLGLSWAFGMPTFDIIRGTTIDYMHCVCEGVVQQLLNAWFSQDKKEELFHYPMYWLNRKVQGSEREWWRREWKGARFFFVTLPINPKIMFLMYNIIMVLKISRNGVIIPPMQTTVFGKVGLRFWELQMNMYSFTVYMYFLQVHSSWHTMSTSFCTWETQWKMLDHFGAIPAFFFWRSEWRFPWFVSWDPKHWRTGEVLYFESSAKVLVCGKYSKSCHDNVWSLFVRLCLKDDFILCYDENM